MPPARALIGWKMPPARFGICRRAVQAEPRTVVSLGEPRSPVCVQGDAPQ